MKDVYLINASQAAPIVDALERRGAPVERLSRRSGLPLDAVRKRDGVIGALSFWQFMEEAARLEGCEHLGYEAAMLHPVNTAGKLGGMVVRLEPTLRRTLEAFILDIRGESTGTDYHLRDDSDHVWFRRQPRLAGSDADWLAELYMVTIIIQVVRLCAGPDWLPAVIRLCSSPVPKALPAEWGGVHAEWGFDATEVAVPKSMLALAPTIGEQARVDSVSGARRSTLSIIDVVDRQIDTQEIGLKRAAAETGVSTATLKRRLRARGTSYSQIVERRRYHRAQQMLTESDASMKQIAEALGYRHQANFSRAFVRLSGLSPTVYRARARSSTDQNR